MLSTQAASPRSTFFQPIQGQLGAKVHDNVAGDRLKSTAKEFEATLLSTLLKEMRQTLDEDGGLFPGDSGDVQGGLFDMFMSRHLAESGGIGLAPYLERQMHANASTKPVASADATTPPAHATHELLPATPRR